MRDSTPLTLIPGSWDDLVARAALKVVDWVHDRLSRRIPTVAGAAPPADPWAGQVQPKSEPQLSVRSPRTDLCDQARAPGASRRQA